MTWYDTTENCYKMVLERLDCLFSLVPLMVVGGEELICHDFGLDGLFQIVGAFILGWVVGQEFGWGAVEDDGVGVLVLDHVHQ